ncbi:hypothetical protein PtB15_2B341 [Puccinia triticina]|nr:hypothetical protein PtB15_2B341 [Puccinia triticina]
MAISGTGHNTAIETAAKSGLVGPDNTQYTPLRPQPIGYGYKPCLVLTPAPGLVVLSFFSVKPAGLRVAPSAWCGPPHWHRDRRHGVIGLS